MNQTKELHIGQTVRARFITLSADPGGTSREEHPVRTGRIVYINRAHRYVIVESGVFREGFKFWEVEVIVQRSK